MNQDSTIIETTLNLPQEKDSIGIKVERPVILAIPETPGRFLPSARKKKEKKIKLFSPSKKDSVEFNLIERPKENEGFLQGNLVKDYLNPLATDNAAWFIDGSSAVPEIEVADVRESEISNQDSLRVNEIVQDSIVAKQDFVVDSLSSHVDSLTIEKKEGVNGGTEQLFEVELTGEEGFLKNSDKDILSGMLLVSVAIVGLLRMTNYKYLRELFSAVVFGQNARKMKETVNLRNKKHAIILNFLFLFNSSIFAYQFISYYNIHTIFGNRLLIIPLIMGVLLTFGVLKSILYKFVAFVFEKEKQTSEYLFYTFLHNKVFSLVILPIALIIPYIDQEVLPMLFKLGFALFALMYLLQILRGIAIILNNVASLFYLFLYLCALEILPLVIMYKILIN